MILVAFIAVLMIGGILAWIAANWNSVLSRWISVVALLLDFVLALFVWLQNPTIESSNWMIQFSAKWIPSLGVSFSLALDGLSLLMVLLTFFLGIFAVLISWKEIQERVGFFHFNLLWVLAGITGVFLTMDLFLFYFLPLITTVPQTLSRGGSFSGIVREDDLPLISGRDARLRCLPGGARPRRGAGRTGARPRTRPKTPASLS